MAEFARIQQAYPGMKAVTNAGQLILSSPKARVPYHFDPAGVVLFHLRGRKRIFVYPGDEAHLPEACMEQVVARQTTEELPYVRAFEGDATVIDLEPGQALTWPLYAPHRVENLDRFCVSLSMDFQTWPSRWRNGRSTPTPCCAAAVAGPGRRTSCRRRSWRRAGPPRWR